MSVVEVTVKSQKGKCHFGHKVGDKIIFNGRTIKGPICYSALAAILPRIYAMRFNAEFPWEEDKNVVYGVCLDHKNPVVFEIRRTKKK
jgi:uncharacterized repeat protein (TIGR04076 family)